MVSLITVHGKHRTVGKLYKEIILLCALCFLVPSVVTAQFVLDFAPKGNGVVTEGMARGGGCCSTPQSAFLVNSNNRVDEEKPEIVTDPDTGISYYHLINGDPLDGFAQEVFIEITGTRCWGRCRPGSASGGSGGTVLFTGQHLDGNSHDPLDSSGAIVTGNGSGTPDKVIIRQFLNDGDIFQEFLKDTADRKPRITQMSFLPEMDMFFDLDMRNTTYSDDTTAGNFINTLTFQPGEINFPGGMEEGANFSMTRSSAGDVTMQAGGKDGQAVNANVTGGRYTYTGAYNYLEGNFDHTAINWEQFFDATAGNLWTYGDHLPEGGVSVYD